MSISHIEHIGIAVKNLAQAIELWENLLGIPCYNIEEVAEQKVKTAFFRVGDTKIELLESTDAEGPIGKFIDKRGEGVHHLAFAVKGLENELIRVNNEGLQLIDHKPRQGAEGLSIAFLHPKSTNGVLVELCENKGL